MTGLGRQQTSGVCSPRQPLGHLFAYAMEASAPSTGQAFRLDSLFDTGNMGRERAAIGCTGFGVLRTRRAIRFVLGMDERNSRLKVFQCEIELRGSETGGSTITAANSTASSGAGRTSLPCRAVVLKVDRWFGFSPWR